MAYAVGQTPVWPVPPDWKKGVRERLSWLTRVIPIKNRVTAKHEMRLAPRREFSFVVIADKQDRRVADALLFDQGAKRWLLPIWPDIQLLSVAANISATSISCQTTGFDFVVGGKAILWRSVNSFEVVTISSIGVSTLGITSTPLAATWPAGTRLYPVRFARVLVASEESYWNDDAGERRINFLIDESCDYAGSMPAATYRSYPVLEHRGEESSDPKISYKRDIDTVDEDTGIAHHFDYPAQAFVNYDHDWMLSGRVEIAAFRALLYGLRGRMGVLWIPSMKQDFVLASAATAIAVTLSVEWAGYTLYGKQQSNRRDLRIELSSGAVLYRRITNSVEAGANETLTLDTALGVAFTPAQVRLISFMALCEPVSDAVEIDHQTDSDGIALSALNFQAIAHEF